MLSGGAENQVLARANGGGSGNFLRCVDKKMIEHTGKNLSVLLDFEKTPVLTTGAWVGLAGTLGWGIASSVYQSVKYCKNQGYYTDIPK